MIIDQVGARGREKLLWIRGDLELHYMHGNAMDNGFIYIKKAPFLRSFLLTILTLSSFFTVVFSSALLSRKEPF